MLFVLNGKLEDDAADILVSVCRENTIFDVLGGGSTIINHINADVGTIFDFEINIFGDDGIIAIADDEERRFFGHTANLSSLAFFDEIC